MQLRFEDAITFHIDDNVLTKEGNIIPLALQLLLENCIQHNIVSDEKQLHVEITTENDVLVVSNNLQEKKIKHNSSKIGLRNITERYKLLTNRPVEIIKSEDSFVVKLPILKNNA